MQQSIFSRRGVDRIMKYAFELASTRKKHVTSCTKSNGISITMPYWDERFAEMKKKYPGREGRPVPRRRPHHPDGAQPGPLRRRSSPPTCSATSSPTSGRRPPAPSASPPRATSTRSAPRRRSSSRCTARRPTSPAGRSPTRSRAIWSGALMLEHLGHAEAAADVVRAIERVVLEGPHTPGHERQGEHRRSRRRSRGGRAQRLARASPRLAHLRSAGVEVAGPMPHTWITTSSPFAPS